MSSQGNFRNSLLQHPFSMSRPIVRLCVRCHPNKSRNSACSTTTSGSRVGNRLSIFQAEADDLYFVAMMDRALTDARKCDETELHEIIRSPIASSHGRTEEGEGEWAWKLIDRQTPR